MVAGSGCGRLGFDQVPDDPGVLGAVCDSSGPFCAPELACVSSFCNCTVALASDEHQTCALGADGSVWCAGDNSNGELGTGILGGGSTEPVMVADISGIAGIDVGAFHACTRNGAGEVWCWGEIDEEGARARPEPVPGLRPVIEIAAGGFHACFLDDAGEVWCMGRDSSGQIGQGAESNTVAAPTRVPGLTGVSAIGAGGFHTCGIVAGSVWCWGENSHGQIGNDVIGGNQPSPVQVMGLSNIVAVTAGDWHSCALRGDGTVWCWGKSDNGQTGDASTGVDDAVPRQVAGLTDIVDIYSGDEHSCAIDQDGVLYCWGFNGSGQIGTGQTGQVEPLTQVNGIGPAVDVTLSRRDTCALGRDGTVSCWGGNASGEHGAGTAEQSAAPRASLFSCD